MAHRLACIRITLPLLLVCLLLSACAKQDETTRRPANMAGPVSLLNSTAKAKSFELSVAPVLDLGAKKVTGPFNDKSNKMKAMTVATFKGEPRSPAGVLIFDLYLLGTWDDEGMPLADEWRMTALTGNDAPKAFFSLKQFGDFPTEGRLKVGRHELDVTRKTMRVTLPPLDAEGVLRVEMKGFLTGQATELWAIDNLRLEPLVQ